MNIDIETSFVKKYIKKEYQDRLLFELSSKKNRQRAISRFSHDSDIILINSFVKTNIEKLKQQNNEHKKIYIISEDECDGTIMELSQAFDFLEKTYMAAILISDKFAIVKEEIEGKAPTVLICDKR
jgi:hypothetical protein